MSRLASRPMVALSSILLLSALVFLLVQVGHAEPKKGDVITNSIGMTLAYIPPGHFNMGSSEAEQNAALADYMKWKREKADAETVAWRRAEGPEHEVEITKGFYLGLYEVTQGEYKRVLGKNPSHFSATGKGKDQVGRLDTSRFPVESVTYQDALKFCETMSALAVEQKEKRSYRLPTEAEWESACRGGAGKKTTFHYGASLSSKEANFNGKCPYGDGKEGAYLGRTCQVGLYEPNGYGLYDMHGNVWEWCADWYDPKYYAASPRKDPAGPIDGTARVLRGGSWEYFGRDCRSSRRNTVEPPPWPSNIGFRVVMVPAGE